MPMFHRAGEVRFAALITGPRHVLIGLAFGEPGETDARCDSVDVVEMASAGRCTHGAWDLDALRAAIARGVASGNQRFGLDLRVRAIHFVRDDPPDEALAERCAFLIVQRIADGDEFPVATQA